MRTYQPRVSMLWGESSSYGRDSSRPRCLVEQPAGRDACRDPIYRVRPMYRARARYERSSSIAPLFHPQGRRPQLLSRMLGSSLLLVLLAVLVTGCNIPYLPGSTTSATACPSPVPFQATSGTIQSINGTTLLITATNGSTVTATYTSTTRFTRQTKVTTAALQIGTFVFVAVRQNADNSYTAARITLSNAANAGSRPGGAFGGSGRRGGNGSACGGRRGTFGGNGGQDFAGGNGSTRGISGTVSQLKGNTLTVTDVNQADYTVTLNSTTQIIQTSQAAATSLQVGLKVNLVGSRNAQGVLTARSVTILPSGSGK